MIRLIIVILIGLAIYGYSQAETYKYKNGLVVEAKTFKLASYKCFEKLTGGVYPGEESGMNIIDICVNPRNDNIN